MDNISTPIIHFICSECGYFSERPGICQTDDCSMQNLPLKECHCEDGKHDGVKNKWTEDTDNDAEGNQSVKTIDLDE